MGGAPAAACRSPRLSVNLAQKPLRISKRRPGAAVRQALPLQRPPDLRDQRQAPLGAEAHAIEILNKVGKRTVEKPGTTIARQGPAASHRWPTASSRTLTFRFSNSDGQRSQVTIKIRVEKKKRSARR